MREKLLGYLLGDLDPEQTAAVEAELERDSDLAAEVERLRQCVEGPRQSTSPAAADQPAAPSGLADRTAESVSMLATELAGGTAEPPSRRSSFSLLDAAVAIGVVVAVAMMLVPALQQSRESSRQTICRNNLREIGLALHGYAADHAGFFPKPPPNANAGSFAITLADTGHLDRRRLAELVVCPGSPEARAVAGGELRVRIPTYDELESADGATLEELRRVMALNVAYRLPYRNDQGLVPIRDQHKYRQPLLSDAPSIVDGRWRSLNHSGHGVNVLYQDGSARYHVDFREPVRQDHFFVNADGVLAMPTSPEDAVLARSEYVPQPAEPSLRVRAQVRLRSDAGARVLIVTPGSRSTAPR